MGSERLKAGVHRLRLDGDFEVDVQGGGSTVGVALPDGRS